MKSRILLLFSVLFGFTGKVSANIFPDSSKTKRIKSVTEYKSPYQFGKPSIHKYKRGQTKFDEQGRVIEQLVIYNDDTFQSHESYKYDANGNIVEKTTYTASGYIISKIELKYDENGKCLSEIRRFPRGRIIEQYGYKYDEYDNLIQKIKYDYRGRPLIIWKYEYEYYP